jgi:2-dehydropantoate 2-reductase
VKIAVIGAGAIGSLVAAYLRLKDEDVSLVGRSDAVSAIRKNGLKISGARGDFSLHIEINEKLVSPPEVTILATKTQDIEQALRDNIDLLKGSVVLTTQNGAFADSLVSRYIAQENIISSIIMFGATYLRPGEVVHNFEGSWIIGNISGRNNEKVIRVSSTLSKIFPIIISQDIKGMKYLKIFLNANNCIPAILGVSMQEAFSDLEISRVSIAIWKEGLDTANKSGIDLVSLPGFPLERLTKLASLPTIEAAKIFSGIMAGLSREPLYGSILQSIKRGRVSEIDYINGEFANIAKDKNLKVPLNEKLVEMVHEVEKTKRFFSKKELIEQVKGLVN